MCSCTAGHYSLMYSVCQSILYCGDRRFHAWRGSCGRMLAGSRVSASLWAFTAMAEEMHLQGVQGALADFVCGCAEGAVGAKGWCAFGHRSRCLLHSASRSGHSG